VSQKSELILLVGKPGPLRNALQSLIGTMPDLPAPVTADSGLLALRVIRDLRPGLIVLGSDLPEDEVLELLRQIKEEWPNTACLVFVESSQQRRSALAAGADHALSVGVPAGHIFAAIRQILEDD
jgi:DNA-binding NarL/FixJ family response regulator